MKLFRAVSVADPSLIEEHLLAINQFLPVKYVSLYYWLQSLQAHLLLVLTNTSLVKRPVRKWGGQLLETSFPSTPPPSDARNLF